MTFGSQAFSYKINSDKSQSECICGKTNVDYSDIVANNFDDVVSCDVDDRNTYGVCTCNLPGFLLTGMLEIRSFATEYKKKFSQDDLFWSRLILKDGV